MSETWAWPGAGYCEICGERTKYGADDVPKAYCSQACKRVLDAQRKPKTPRVLLPVGTRRLDLDGYINVKVSDNPSTWRSEHSVVMEAHIGRPLKVGENVHHRNGIRSDNAIENLELWVKQQPAGQRVADLIAFVVKNYPEETRAELETATDVVAREGAA